MTRTISTVKYIYEGMNRQFRILLMCDFNLFSIIVLAACNHFIAFHSDATTGWVNKGHAVMNNGLSYRLSEKVPSTDINFFVLNAPCDNFGLEFMNEYRVNGGTIITLRSF